MKGQVQAGGNLNHSVSVQRAGLIGKNIPGSGDVNKQGNLLDSPGWAQVRHLWMASPRRKLPGLALETSTRLKVERSGET